MRMTRQRKITWCLKADNIPNVCLITSKDYVEQCQILERIVNSHGYTLDEITILSEIDLQV